MPHWCPRNASCSLSEDQVKGMLKKYDLNGDGKLSKKELKLAFQQMGLVFSGWRAWRALRHADANKDGFISEEELNDLVEYAKKWGFTIS